MLDFLSRLLSSDEFMPHGHCYLWRPGVVWLHVVSDAVIALAYTTIPFTLFYFVRRRRDLPFRWMFLCFGLFIIACGATHGLEIITLWRPLYWLSGLVKAVTALASLLTALLLIQLVPRALALPSPADMRRADEALRTSEARLLAAIVASSEDAIVSLSLSGEIESWNPGAERLYGYTAQEALGQPRTLTIPAHERDEIMTQVDRLVRGERIEDFEAIRQRKSGSLIDVSVRVSPIRDEAGVVTGISGIARDITASKEADRRIKASLQEKEVLLKEVHHRVKNNLQVVSSLLNIEAGRMTHPEAIDAFRKSQSRVRSIAAFHEGVYQAKDLANVDMARYLGDLLRGLRGTYGAPSDGVATQVRAEGVELSADLAIPCGLIANELITNAFKHAFPLGGGTIDIAIERRAGGLVLRVADDGVGLPSDFDLAALDSLGLQLVQTLSQQIGGSLGVDSASRGVAFTVTFNASS